DGRKPVHGPQVERVHRGLTGVGASPSGALALGGRLAGESSMKRLAGNAERASWLLVSPLVAILAFFLLLPIATIVMVSFWNYNEFTFFPDFVLDNYAYLLSSKVTLATYLKPLKFMVLTWIFCTAIGFTVAYFLAFHVRTLGMQIALFLVCTIPFWTSNIIRMIS